MKQYTWIAYAYKEWKLSSNPFDDKVNNKDFFWLVIILFIALFLLFIINGAYKGIYYQIMDSSIGYIENIGVPIWFERNQDILKDSYIGRNIIQQIENIDKKNISVYPWVNVSYNNLSLPGYTPSYIPDSQPIWHDENNLKNNIDIKIKAISHFKDPLWGNAQVDHMYSTPLEVIIDQTLFEKHFSCERYIKELEKNNIYINNTDIISEKIYCFDSNSKIWLKIKIQGKEEWHQFRVKWRKKIYTNEDIAILLPLSTYNMIRLSNKILKKSPLITTFYLDDNSRINDPKEPVLKYTENNYLIFPKSYLLSRIQKKEYINVHQDLCCLDVNHVYKYSDIFVYIKNRVFFHTIQRILKTINKNNKKINVNEIYEKNIARLNFIYEILHYLKNILTIIFLFYFGMLLYSQLGVIIDHRRYNYGIMLSKGFLVSQLYLVFFIQVFFSFIFAWTGAIVMYCLCKRIFSNSLEKIALEYSSYFNTSNFDLLPIPYYEIRDISIMVLLTSLGISIIILLRLGLTKNLEPSRLIH
ncbi:membrane protein containing DUF214, permase predicted [Candidatus Magnetomorum sp. HK-1]|nr:membrane protein containing DUF214, permase predicted [Candidatus Magnetomorum sp. HK-1]